MIVLTNTVNIANSQIDMNTKEVQTLESYFKTENEHWNSFALKTICKALEKQLFSDFNNLMELYEFSINMASESHR